MTKFVNLKEEFRFDHTYLYLLSGYDEIGELLSKHGIALYNPKDSKLPGIYIVTKDLRYVELLPPEREEDPTLVKSQTIGLCCEINDDSKLVYDTLPEYFPTQELKTYTHKRTIDGQEQIWYKPQWIKYTEDESEVTYPLFFSWFNKKYADYLEFQKQLCGNTKIQSVMEFHIKCPTETFR